jgi:hypothetical protein
MLQGCTREMIEQGLFFGFRGRLSGDVIEEGIRLQMPNAVSDGAS